MAHPKAAWGIEIGANAIKAIRLEREGDLVKVDDFCVIPHKRVLTTPDLDEDEMTRLSLGQFISQKSLEGEHLVMSVPGHSAFARFAKLPPVEPKKIPDIVKFEAVQQIPFPIEEVEWDYQTFTSEDSPEVEVGIFAITRERIQQRLSIYGELGLTPEAMTLSPLAVYNAMAYDMSLAGQDEPIVFLDIGTQATDVIVAEAGRCWIRTFPLGGTHFTEAIASAFKLTYTKADKLKHESSSSKYAKQIMQAMRPVFSDLLQDLQRSIGYYQSLHRDSELKTLVGLGSTFKIPGLRKFIGQQLQVNTIKLDEYKKITVTGREAASFAENTVNMATAYGLALQGVGLAEISANLVPVKALREQMWHSKTKWFAAAAAVMVFGAGMTFYRPLMDNGKMNQRVPSVVENALERGAKLKSEFESLKSSSSIGYSAENMRRLLLYRDVWPYLMKDAAVSLASAEPQPELLENDAELILGIDPEQRRLIQLEKLEGQYVPPTEEDPTRRIISITMSVELSHKDPTLFLNDTVVAWLRENREREGVPYRIVEGSISSNPTELEIVTVTESGEETVKPQGSGGSPRDDRRGNASGVGSPPPRTPPSGARGTGSSGPAISAPGGGISGPSAFGAGSEGGGRDAGPASNDDSRGGGGRPARSSGPGGSGDEDLNNPFLDNLDGLAPMPKSPRLYKPGAKYYKAKVTFQVELIDPDAPPPAPKDDDNSQASASTSSGGASS